MGLKPEDLALFERVVPGNTSLTNFTDVRVDHDDFAKLLDAARAEGRAEVEGRAQALFEAWKNEHGLVCDANPEETHNLQPHPDGYMFCFDCGEVPSKRQVQQIGRMKNGEQRRALSQQEDKGGAQHG